MKTGLVLLALLAAALTSSADGLAIDFAKEKGLVRRLNGICNTARINNSMHAKSDQLPIFKDLEIPCSRYHDAALNNPTWSGGNLVNYKNIKLSACFSCFACGIILSA